MKKKMIKSLLTIACLLSSISVSAYDFEVDGLQYDVVSLSDLTCKLVGTSNKDGFEGDVVIPANVNYSNKTLTVAEIESGLFRDCYDMTGVTIPNTISLVEEYMFRYCTSLTDLYSLNVTPPATGPFTNNQYMALNVYVPEEALEAYQNAEGWKEFWNLQGFDPTGIKDVEVDGVKGDGKYYDLRGNKLDAPKHGINIINGKKVVVK